MKLLLKLKIHRKVKQAHDTFCKYQYDLMNFFNFCQIHKVVVVRGHNRNYTRNFSNLLAIAAPCYDHQTAHQCLHLQSLVMFLDQIITLFDYELYAWRTTLSLPSAQSHGFNGLLIIIFWQNFFEILLFWYFSRSSIFLRICWEVLNVCYCLHFPSLWCRNSKKAQYL